MTSDDALGLTGIPKSIVIVGAGVIGCEWAFIFRELGADVTVIEMLPRALASEDTEVSALIEREMKARHIYAVVDAIVDRRKKPHRIQQALAGITAHGAFYVHSSMQGFITQYYAYPNTDKDDRLDSCAMGLGMLHNLAALDQDGALWGADSEMKQLTYKQESLSP